MFNISMESYDSTGFELVGTYLLLLLLNKIKQTTGLYHHNGLANCNGTPSSIELKKSYLRNLDTKNL